MTIVYQRNLLLSFFFQLEQLAFHLVTRQKEGGRFNRMLAGSEKHVVLCATTPRATMLIDFLNEFYADVRLQVCKKIYFMFICLMGFWKQ